MIKRLLVLFFTLCAFAVMQAQDIIITNAGNVYKAYEIEVSSQAIFYKDSISTSAPIKRLDKKEVMLIKYADGRKVMIADDQEPSTSNTPKDNLKIGQPDERENQRLINLINNENVACTVKKDGKQAKGFFGQFFVTPESQLVNKDIEITYTSGRLARAAEDKFFPHDYGFEGRSIEVTVKNKTDKTVFIDLGNTFFIREGEASPYFTGSIVSTTSGKSSGASIGLGGIANAIGIGGAAGQILSGVTVGGGKSTTTTTTTYEQRIISIPPMSVKTLNAQLILPNDPSYVAFGYVKRYAPALLYRGLYAYTYRTSRNPVFWFDYECKRGETLLWEFKDSPIKWGTYITYSFDNSFETKAHLKADFFLKKAIGVKKGFTTYEFEDEEAFSNVTENTLFFTAGY